MSQKIAQPPTPAQKDNDMPFSAYIGSDYAYGLALRIKQLYFMSHASKLFACIVD